MRANLRHDSRNAKATMKMVKMAEGGTIGAVVGATIGAGLGIAGAFGAIAGDAADRPRAAALHNRKRKKKGPPTA